MAVDVLLGLQWGDEGKGKIVDHLADNYDIICRFQGGPNAGHSLHFDGNKFVLHTVPSGIFRDHCQNVIGSGVVIDPITLMQEIDEISSFGVDVSGKLIISQKAHLILPTHRLLDAASELAKGKKKIGSTLKGIGPTYMDKTGRNGLRMGDVLSRNFLKKYKELKKKHQGLLMIYPKVNFNLSLEEEKWLTALERLKDYTILDAEHFVHTALSQGKKILAEGAQGSMLDIDFGTYPYVTSSNTLSCGACQGLGIPPKKIGKVIGIAKAYTTRVGSGPFPTELNGTDGMKLQELGHEFGATTGRPRRCGWLDLVQLNYSLRLNGVDELVITKLDVLSGFDTIGYTDQYQLEDGSHIENLPYDLSDVDSYNIASSTLSGWRDKISDIRTLEGLPKNARSFLQLIQNKTNVPIKYISVGPDREELIVL